MRQIEGEDREMNMAYEDWMAKDKDTQIDEVKTKREKEMSDQKRKMQKIEKAKERQGMWKKWRNSKDKTTGSGTDDLQ